MAHRFACSPPRTRHRTPRRRPPPTWATASPRPRRTSRASSATRPRTYSGTVSDKVKTAADFSEDDGSTDSVPDTATSTPAYSTSSEGLRADAAAADAQTPFDIDEAGSDDLAAQPNPLGTDDPDARA